jgi:DNA-binding response OmpR family regulator
MSHILLVEPDRVLAKIYYQALVQADHSVAVAHTAQGAVSAADRQCPDLIILELQLVEHSGIEFLYELRSYQDWQGIPIIIQAQVPPGEFTASRALLKEQFGISSYLYKPQSSLEDLLDSVSKNIPVQA